MSIFIASDHAGFKLKQHLCNQRNLIDLGTDSEDSCDYPIFAKKLVHSITNSDQGILVCGTGIGMSIVANRFEHIRAALCFTPEMAALARQHNDANVLVLGARIISPETADSILKKFLSTSFEGGRHQRRVNLINNK